MTDADLIKDGLLACANALHSHLAGNSVIDDPSGLVSFVRMRMADWRPSRLGHEAYDSIVHSLLALVISEYDRKENGGSTHGRTEEGERDERK